MVGDRNLQIIIGTLVVVVSLFALFGVAIINVDVGVENDFFLPLQDDDVNFANTSVLARAAAVIDVDVDDNIFLSPSRRLS
jgi:hypothetical protein